MNVLVNADVQCADGPGGTITHAVINPLLQQVTHVVVRERALQGHSLLVPVEAIAESMPERVRLRLTRAQLAQMQRFEVSAWVKPIDQSVLAAPGLEEGAEGLLYWPYVPLDEELVVTSYESVPPGELAVRRGDAVEARDGHVGRIDELLVDPKSHGITHLIMRTGHLWMPRDVTIPVGTIARITDGAVYLTLDKRQIAALPTAPARRPQWWPTG